MAVKRRHAKWTTAAAPAEAGAGEFDVRVVMLGWEFPPFISGGLGTACHGLSHAMGRLGTHVLFVLPDAIETTVYGSALPAAAVSRRQPVAPPQPAAPVQFLRVPGSVPNPYGTPAATPPLPAQQHQHQQQFQVMSRRATAPAAAPRDLPTIGEKIPLLKVKGSGAGGGYDGDLIGKIHRYAERCVAAAADEPFDIIHAHDWMTFPGAIRLAEQRRRPLVVHVHATEFDRSGEHVNQAVYDIERLGMHAADAVITVSNLTKRTLVQHYGVPASKVRVIYNGIEMNSPPPLRPVEPRREKVVLFLGRITMQKGPGAFLAAMEYVFRKCDDVRAVVAGWGDLGPWMLEQALIRGMGSRMRFAGFLRGKDVDRAFRMADVYVMPSVTEPFGLTALEAIRNGTPVVLSRTSGAAEVLTDGALKVDHWDVETMAEQILSLLKSPQLGDQLRKDAMREARQLTWDVAARSCVELYSRTLPEPVGEPASAGGSPDADVEDQIHESHEPPSTLRQVALASSP